MYLGLILFSICMTNRSHLTRVLTWIWPLEYQNCRSCWGHAGPFVRNPPINSKKKVTETEFGTCLRYSSTYSSFSEGVSIIPCQQ